MEQEKQSRAEPKPVEKESESGTQNEIGEENGGEQSAGLDTTCSAYCTELDE